MKLCFADVLTRGAPKLNEFLHCAIAQESVDRGQLMAAGFARYDIDAHLKKLEAAGEIQHGLWLSEARDAYKALLQEQSAAIQAPPVKAFAKGEGPREKALNDGINSLGDDELLALLLRTGTAHEDVLTLARRLLSQHDGLVGLAGYDVGDLIRANGLGPAKAAEVAGAFELARRLSRAARRNRPKLTDPEAVAALLAADMSALRHEEFWCLALDARSRLLGEPKVISRGDIDGTDAGPRAFFRNALMAGASTAIAVHNHPSGDPSPSQADQRVTRRLVAAGATVDCQLVDHIIIGDGGRYTSLRRDFPDCFART